MSVYRFCREWSAGIADPDNFTASRRWTSVNVFYSGRTIYSYGTHFVMGYMLSPGVVWLNGDRYSNTTSRHQSELRAAVARAGGRAVIVPGSALDAAGIDYRTIEPVSIEAERWDATRHEADEPPAGMRTELPARPYVSFGDNYRSSISLSDTVPPVWSDTGAPADNYVGWILSDGRQQAVMRTAGGRYEWHTIRHWLGDAVFTAERTSRWGSFGSGTRVHWLSSFDRQESQPLYFLSQLPGPADTVDAATESLAPDSVRTARDMGRNVVRQGDMFAIETGMTTRALRAAGATITRRRVTVELTLDAQRQLAVRDALQQIVDGMPTYPQRIYPGTTCSPGAVNALSGWHSERCDEWETELLRRYAQQYPEQQAYHRGYVSWRSALRFTVSAWHRTRDITAEPLLGTAHTATEVATMPNGLQYARGCLYHEPAVIGDRRRADHARRPLSGSTWYLVARNTVPVDGPARGRRRAA